MGIADLQLIFQKYGSEIETFLTRRTSCPETAADLTQEVFLRMLKPIQQGDIGNMRAYLYRAATNLAINHHVAEQRRANIRCQTPDAASEPVESRSPEYQSIHSQRIGLMSEALSELSPLAQQVFYLARIEGMKQAEIANKLDIHITTVEKNLSKAVRHCFNAVLLAEKS